MPIRLQRNIAFLALLLFFIKLWAWYLTGSVTILTDALESTVNVIAGFIGLYSIILASKPRDLNHPYGHGKAEFISAAIEGSLIFIAGLFIVYEAVDQLINPKELKKLDIGLILTCVTGVINFFFGMYAVNVGKKKRSLIIESAGNHMKSDAYSTFAIMIGIGLLLLTGWRWLDSAVALVFSVVIMITGYKLVRRSLAGIMDEADEVLLKQVIDVLQENRRPQWIDLHNLRVIQYGNVMHIDAHITLPWYYQVLDAEREIHELEALVKSKFEDRVEMFVHIDACIPTSCKLCSIADCNVRQEAFKQQLVWTMENVRTNEKHGKENVA